MKIEDLKLKADEEAKPDRLRLPAVNRFTEVLAQRSQRAPSGGGEQAGSITITRRRFALAWQARTTTRTTWAVMLWAFILCVFGAANLVQAQFNPRPAEPMAGPGAVLARSHSGQFIVTAGGFSSASSKVDSNRSLIRLDPTLLPISAEHIKEILYRELGAGNRWEGRIFLLLFPAQSADDAVTIQSEQFRDGWVYRLLVPTPVERVRYVEAMTQVLLLELANRQASAHGAEIPTWLRQGFSEQLLAAHAREVLVSPPEKGPGFLPLGTKVVDAVRDDPLKAAHERLCAGAPLTFQELSWPSDEQLSGKAGEVYRSSAQLFVNELLRLPSGGACLRTMISELPQYYNWQFAFLHAFRNYFQRPLDVEKWWSLNLAHFTGRDLQQTWTADESWQKLDQTIRSAVQVRIGTNELPLHAETSLQTMIREWDSAPQTQALQIKMRELEGLRLRLAQRFVPLLDEYQRTLEQYLQTRDRRGGILPFRKGAARRQAALDTMQQLNTLDARLQDMRPAASQPAAIQADARPGGS